MAHLFHYGDSERETGSEITTSHALLCIYGRRDRLREFMRYWTAISCRQGWESAPYDTELGQQLSVQKSVAKTVWT